MLSNGSKIVLSSSLNDSLNSTPSNDAAITNVCPPNKISKLKDDDSPLRRFVEAETNSSTFEEMSQKLKYLFGKLGAHYIEHRHIFEKLTSTLESCQSFEKPVPVTQSEYFAKMPASSFTIPDDEGKPELPTFQDKRMQEAPNHPLESPEIDENKAELEPLCASSEAVQSNIPSSPVPSRSLRPASREQQKRPFSTLHLATQKVESTMPIEANKPPAPKVVKAISLSDEQQNVLELARKGESIFYTGSAGTGKSLLLKTLIKHLREQHGKEAVGVTASTGLAAYNIGGVTINSYTGIGLGTQPVSSIIRNIKRNKTKRKNWTDVRTLIIDEISMIDGKLIDKLEQIARILKKNESPFGGIQVIFCGDFYQLPPVSKDEKMMFAFESQFWKKHLKIQVILKKVFRQQGDKQFLQMLQEVRDGVITPSTIKKFKALERPLTSQDKLVPTRLFPTRREVDRANTTMISQIEGEDIRYVAVDGGELAGKPQGFKLLDSFLVPQSITLKIGAQVMMVKNMDDELVNGSLGMVVGFMHPDTFDLITNLDEHLCGEKRPKNGIMRSLDTSKTELKNSIFDFLEVTKASVEKSAVDAGILADAIEEKVDSLGSFIINSEPSIQEIDAADEGNRKNHLKTRYEDILRNIEGKIKLLKDLENSEKSNQLLPVVSFRLSSGEARVIAVDYEEFKVEDEHGRTMVSRKQLPLMLAWALSIHKSQGQTLKYVSVDLRKIFENGQAYVALSRAEHRRGLQVLNFDAAKVTTNERVIEFYKKLTDSDTAIEKLGNSNISLNSSFSFDPIAPRKPLGFQTQVRHMHDLAASPERFKRYAKPEPKEAPPGILQLLLSQGDKPKKVKTEICDKPLETSQLAGKRENLSIYFTNKENLGTDEKGGNVEENENAELFAVQFSSDDDRSMLAAFREAQK